MTQDGSQFASTDDLRHAIGTLTQAFSQLESRIETLIDHIRRRHIGTRLDEISRYTSFARKIAALEEVAPQYYSRVGAPQEVRSRLLQVLQTAKELAQIRNQYAHAEMAPIDPRLEEVSLEEHSPTFLLSTGTGNLSTPKAPVHGTEGKVTELQYNAARIKNCATEISEQLEFLQS